MILFSYVLKDYFKFVCGIITLSTFLFILFDFIHKSTRYLSKFNPETQHIVMFYVYQIPSLIVQGLPIAALLAGVVTMVLLNRTNEITAMRASGMGPIRISLPIAFGGIVLSFFSYAVGEFVLPETSKKSQYIQRVLIEKNEDFQIADGAKWVRDGRTLLSFKNYNKEKKELEQLRLIYIGKSFRPKRTIEAKSAKYLEEFDEWMLKDLQIMYFWPNGTLSYTEKRESYRTSFPVEPEKLKKDTRPPSEMSSKELNDVISLGKSSGGDILHYQVDREIKFAFHFASLVLSLIGLKFAYGSERNIETARGILLAIGIGVSYWFIINAGRALGKRGTLPPSVAAWIANMVILFLALYPLFRKKGDSTI